MLSLDQKLRKLNHKRIDAFRSIKLLIAKLFFGPFSSYSEKNENHDVLVLRMDDKLGDGITATGFLREIKKKHRQGKLIVVAGKATAELYSTSGYVDEVFVSSKGVFKTLGLFFKLKTKKYQYIINTSHILNPRVVFLVSFLTAFKKISFANSEYELFSDHINIDFNKEHVTARYRKVLELMGIQQPILDYEAFIPVGDAKDADAYIQDLKKSGVKIVVLNSFSGARLRNFSEKTTKEIVKKLISIPNTLVLSVANEGDHRILDRWVDGSVAGKMWVHNSNFKSISQNLALINCADVVITPDTAWVHIASALKKKLIAVYREDTNPSELNSVIWAPYGTDFKLIFAKNNSASPDDINNVNTEDILRATQFMLEKS
ncbi:hypothetical protein K2P97_03625 [bacterium]|nr:hypothetical protein [bacterium]